MAIKLSRPRTVLAKIVHDLACLSAEQRGSVAVVMGLLMPVLVGGLGLGFEVSNWYLMTRSMQNAADSAVIAAASNASANYGVEAKAVAARYNFVDGSNNVTVTVSNTAACPSGGSTCYSVTITKVVPLLLSQVVGYTGDTALNGAPEKKLSSTAIATKTAKTEQICLLTLGSSGIDMTTNGAPDANFAGCAIMSDASATCHGSNLQADVGLAVGTDNGCGVIQYSNVPPLADPYKQYASAIPSQNTLANASHCNNSYSQEAKVHGSMSGGTVWSGSKTLTNPVADPASVANNTLICGDLRLTGNVTINAPAGAVLYIDNGNLDLNGYTLSTASGSAVTLVFTGDNSHSHIPTDNSGGGELDIQAPSSASAPFPGIALYQDPNLTSGVNVSYAGNSPTWDLTGAVYMPNAQLTMSGAINKSANGAVCMVMVVKDVTINGTGSIYAQSPDGAGCKTAGLNTPQATIPGGRGQLVF